MSKSPNEIKTRYEKRPTQSSSQSTAVNHGKFLVINSFDPKYIEIYTQISTAWYEIVIQIQIKIKISSKKNCQKCKNSYFWMFTAYKIIYFEYKFSNIVQNNRICWFRWPKSQIPNQTESNISVFGFQVVQTSSFCS